MDGRFLITTSAIRKRLILILQEETSEQGALASINLSTSQLILDYGNVSISGTDRVTIRVCDDLGSCTQQELTIEVVGEILIYNAIFPNGDNLNDFFYLQYIDLLEETKSNKVTIFNRWGDEVFSISNYDNDQRIFRGLNNNGKELPSGIYFYKIEFTNRESVTGYVSLRR